MIQRNRRSYFINMWRTRPDLDALKYITLGQTEDVVERVEKDRDGREMSTPELGALEKEVPSSRQAVETLGSAKT